VVPSLDVGAPLPPPKSSTDQERPSSDTPSARKIKHVFEQENDVYLFKDRMQIKSGGGNFIQDNE
jgi:hypothetical protein